MQNCISISISSDTYRSNYTEENQFIDLNYLKAVLAKKFPGYVHLDDVIQEAAIKIWTKKSMFDPSKSAFKTWCVKVGFNACIDFLRKEHTASRYTQSLPDGAESSSTELYPETIGLKNLVNQLDEPEKAVIDLAYYQGYTHQEISDYMAIPLGTVKTRMTRAIRKLRRYFIELNQN